MLFGVKCAFPWNQYYQEGWSQAPVPIWHNQITMISGVGINKFRSVIFSVFASKHRLSFEYHIYIWRMSLHTIAQQWRHVSDMYLMYFDKIRSISYGQFNGRRELKLNDVNKRATEVQLWNNWSSKWPPQEELKCKNAQFLQWILKDDDVYFKKTTAS